MENTHVFKTQDLYEAAYLFSAGIDLSSTYREASDLIFVFENEEKCKTLIRDYWSYKGTVVPKKFADGIKNLREMLYANYK